MTFKVEVGVVVVINNFLCSLHKFNNNINNANTFTMVTQHFRRKIILIYIIFVRILDDKK